MSTFLLLFFQRVFSGAVNGAGYGHRADLVFFFSAIHLGATAACCVLMPDEAARAIMLLPFVVIHLKGAVLMNFRFPWKVLNDIHLFETVIISIPILLVCLEGNSIFLAAATVYPSLILHKGFINLGGGVNFWASSTDDPTGKTWGIPSLGLKIPRTGNRFRILAAVGSLVGVVIYWFVGPDFVVEIGEFSFRF